MSNQAASAIVNKVWSFAHVLRYDGVVYGDCVEHLEAALSEFREVEILLN